MRVFFAPRVIGPLRKLYLHITLDSKSYVNVSEQFLITNSFTCVCSTWSVTWSAPRCRVRLCHLFHLFPPHDQNRGLRDSQSDGLEKGV
jgi:hypothetical protein